MPVNLPGPAYRISKGTLASVFRKGYPEQRRDHRTTRELAFDSCLCRHGPEFYVFESAGWLLRVWHEHVFHTPHPRVMAIHFALESQSYYKGLQVWPDEYGDAVGLRAADERKTLLDVCRGDELHWTAGGRDERHRVADVFINRSWPPHPHNRAVPCGRWLLEQHRAT